MEQIIINQNDNQLINLHSNEPQLITLRNVNTQDININLSDVQEIGIKNKESQILYVEGSGNVVGITDVLVNGVSVVSEGTAYVIVPTKTSELINDSNFITSETDPTVPSYIKTITISDINSWNNKQNELVSGSTIKTINNTSLLGSGNINIDGANYTAGYGINIDSENVIDNTITSYNDLTDLPTIPTATSELTNDSNFVSSNDLSQVAFDGSYTSLSNLPDIPVDTSDLNNDSGFITKDVNDLTYYTLSSNLSAVATSGNYSDLSGTPTIPTDLSELNNDTGFVSETDYASYLHGGVIKSGTNSYDINASGYLYAETQTYTDYGTLANTNFIGKGTLENVITGKGLIDNSVNNLTNYTNNTDLTNLFSNFLKVEEASISIGSIAGQSGVFGITYSLTVPTGYKALGIIGYQLSGNNTATLNVAKLYLSSNTVTYSLYNLATGGSSASDSTFKLYVLYQKI